MSDSLFKVYVCLTLLGLKRIVAFPASLVPADRILTARIGFALNGVCRVADRAIDGSAHPSNIGHFSVGGNMPPLS
jgi:hypothetical protein